MNRFSRHAQIFSLTLALAVVAPQTAAAQQLSQGRRAEIDPRIQDLINTRKTEHWEFWETRFGLTPPPAVELKGPLPEWDPVGHVILAINENLIRSFALNNYYHTEAKGAEVLRRDPSIVQLIRSSLSNKAFAKKDLTEELEDTLDELTYAHTIFKLINELHKRTKILIILHGESTDEDELYDFVKLAQGFPGAAELLSSSNVTFLSLPITTMWIRDYGPIFVRAADGQIICVDTRYDTQRDSIETKRQRERDEQLTKVLKESEAKAQSKGKAEGDSGSSDEEERKTAREGRLGDDISPSLLATRLRQTNGQFLHPFPITVVRPPIALDGGDFFTDGKGVGFTSTDTLQRNGGNVESLNLIFEQYFGVHEMVYLEPLPGETVKHIDMFFKVVNQEVILIGKFEANGDGTVASALQTEAKRTLDYNLNVLRAFYERRGKVHIVDGPGESLQAGAVNLVTVPMPPLLRPVREEAALIEQEINRVTKRYQELKNVKSVADAYARLGEVVETLEDGQSGLQEMLSDMSSTGAAPAVYFEAVGEYCDEMIDAIKDWYSEHQANPKGLQEDKLNQSLTSLSRFLSARGQTAAAPKLEDVERLVAALKATLQQIEVTIASFKQQQTALKRGYDRYVKEMSDLKESYSDTLKKFEQLSRRFPHGSDIYRTFLNALEINDGKSSVLILPTYKGLETMQASVTDTFRMAYSQPGNRGKSDRPSIEIITFDSDYFIRLYGAIHCLTQTIPAEVTVFPSDWNYRRTIKH